MIEEWGSWMGMRVGDWWGEVVESGVEMGVCGEGGLRTALSQFPDSQKFNNPLSPILHHSTPLSSDTFPHSQPFPTLILHHFLPLFLSTSALIPLHNFMFYYLTYSLNEFHISINAHNAHTYTRAYIRTHIYTYTWISFSHGFLFLIITYTHMHI